MCGWRSWAQARLSRRKRSRHTDGLDPVRPNDLDGDVVAKQRAMREIDLAHPARGELPANLVLPVEEGSFGKHRVPVYLVR